MDSYYNSPPNWPPPPDWQFWGPGPTPPPARNRGRLWLIIGVPVAVVALIVVGSITAFVVFLGNAVGPPRDAASSYVQALQEKRYDAAFAMRCPGNGVDRDSFVAQWNTAESSGRSLTGFKIVGAKVESINGRTTGKVDLKVSYGDGSHQSEQITLTKSGETWMPCS